MIQVQIRPDVPRKEGRNLGHRFREYVTGSILPGIPVNYQSWYQITRKGGGWSLPRYKLGLNAMRVTNPRKFDGRLMGDSVGATQSPRLKHCPDVVPGQWSMAINLNMEK